MALFSVPSMSMAIAFWSSGALGFQLGEILRSTVSPVSDHAF